MKKYCVNYSTQSSTGLKNENLCVIIEADFTNVRKEDIMRNIMIIVKDETNISDDTLYIHMISAL